MERRKRLLSSLGPLLWLFLSLLSSSHVADCQDDDSRFYSPNPEYDSCVTCPDQESAQGRPLLCRCDSNCTLYGDCCNSHLQSPNSTTSDDDADRLNGLLQCRSVHLDEQTQPAPDESFWMVSACPADWLAGRDDPLLLDIDNNCLSGSEDLPPVTDLQTGLVYKSEYCALCHGVQSFIQWGYTFECNPVLGLLTLNPNFTLTLDVVQQYCLVCGFRDPHETDPSIPAARSCVHRSLVNDLCLDRESIGAITDVPISQQDYKGLVSECHNGLLSPVGLFNERPYRNQFCALCNGIPSEGLSCANPYNSRDRTNHCQLKAATLAPPTSEPPTTTTEASTQPPTTEGTTQPPTTTATTQPPTTEATTQMPTETQPTPAEEFNITEIEINITEIEINIEFPLAAIPPPPLAFETEINRIVVQPESFVVQPEIRLQPFTVFINPDRDSNTMITAGTTTISVPTSCEDGQVFDYINQICRKTACPQVARGQPCILTTQSDEVLNSTNGTLSNDTFLPCDEEFLIRLNDSEFTLVDNETLKFGGEIFEIIGYINGSAVICTNFSQNGTVELNVTILFYSYPIGLTVLTYVSCSLSVIGCVIVLLTYSLFKELRTLPGKILMNLCASILATSLFLVAGIPLFAISEKEGLCHTTAIFIHWFVLSEFSWMTIMSWELARTLIRASRLQQTESDKVKRKIFLIYLLIGWGIPTFITGLSIVLNYTTDYIEYGEDGFCWIGDVSSLYAIFLVPIALSLLLNGIAFFVTGYLLGKAQRGEAKLQKQQSISYRRIHLSVFSITGLTWLFGIVAILAQDDWAWYIFIILTMTQGFTICAAFLFTQKIFSFYKERVWSKVYSKFSIKSSLKQSTQDISLAIHYVKKSENTSTVSGVSVKDTEIGLAIEPSETQEQETKQPVRYTRDENEERTDPVSEREKTTPVRYTRDEKRQDDERTRETDIVSEREKTTPVRYTRDEKRQDDERTRETDIVSETEKTTPVRYAKKQDEEHNTE